MVLDEIDKETVVKCTVEGCNGHLRITVNKSTRKCWKCKKVFRGIVKWIEIDATTFFNQERN